MAITTLAQLEAALQNPNNRQKIYFSKLNSIGSAVGSSGSFWRSGGLPATPPMPTIVEVCNHTTLGGMNYTPDPLLNTHIAQITACMTPAITAATSYELHDRLVHMGGLSGIVVTAQTVGIDLNALAATDNLSVRKGNNDYSQVQWWLESYTAIGSTASTVTVNYLNQNGEARTTTVALSSLAAGRIAPIIPNTEGDYIRGIVDLQLSASTGTAGNFGVTATVQRNEIAVPAMLGTCVLDWPQTGFTIVHNNSCLFLIGLAHVTTLQPPTGWITLVRG